MVPALPAPCPPGCDDIFVEWLVPEGADAVLSVEVGDWVVGIGGDELLLVPLVS